MAIIPNAVTVGTAPQKRPSPLEQILVGLISQAPGLALQFIQNRQAMGQQQQQQQSADTGLQNAYQAAAGPLAALGGPAGEIARNLVGGSAGTTGPGGVVQPPAMPTTPGGAKKPSADTIRAAMKLGEQGISQQEANTRAEVARSASRQQLDAERLDAQTVTMFNKAIDEIPGMTPAGRELMRGMTLARIRNKDAIPAEVYSQVVGLVMPQTEAAKAQVALNKAQAAHVNLMARQLSERLKREADLSKRAEDIVATLNLPPEIAGAVAADPTLLNDLIKTSFASGQDAVRQLVLSLAGRTNIDLASGQNIGYITVPEALQAAQSAATVLNPLGPPSVTLDPATQADAEILAAARPVITQAVAAGRPSAEIKKTFIDNAVAHGVDAKHAQDLWLQIVPTINFR